MISSTSVQSIHTTRHQQSSVHGDSSDPAVQSVAKEAVARISDGARVGLGSGRASSVFIELLGARVQQGLRVTGVATSRASAALAERVGIPLIDLGLDVTLDLVVDGADEVAPNLDLVKGWGGALVRERIVTAASQRQLILVDESKRVRALGQRGRIPVEVIPLAQWLVTRALTKLGMVPTLRKDASGAKPVFSDNGNITLDCAPSEPLVDGASARECERALRAIVGVVDTGLFLGTASEVLVGHPDGRVETLHRTSP